MKYKNYISEININRPLMFLCGPASSDRKTNRRVILSDYLNIYNKINKVHPFPIIVDSIFPIEKIKKYDTRKIIKVTVLEEIVSAIAYRTYIFLDTMSTGYELGQFVNSRSKNRVRIFVDKQYDKRLACSIGAYIKDSFEIDKKEVRYTADYDAQGHIFFKRNRLPRPIKNIIDKDFNNYENTVSFDNLGKSKSKSDTITWNIQNDAIEIKLDIKSAFYLMAAVADKNSIPITKPWNSKVENKIFNTICNKMEKNLFECLLTNSRNIDLLFLNKNIKMNIENYPDKLNILYHIYFLLRMIAITSSGFGYYKKAIGEEDFTVKNVISFLEFDFTNICHLNEFDIKTINEYCINPDNFVYKFKYQIKGKTKEIVTYKNNMFGLRLRQIHNKINNGLLKILPTSKSSYAYKKGANTLLCVKQHEDGIYFSKLDIHSYFNSIKYRPLMRLIRDYSINNEDKYLSYYDDLRDIIKVCFYKYKLPIGFVTSPVISDFFLYDLDMIMSKTRSITYTRYADDILISSRFPTKRNNAKCKVKKILNQYGLKLNEKCLDKDLIHENDSIKFLGINIVRQINSKNRLTISTKVLVKISKQVQKYFDAKKHDYLEASKLNSTIAYIKSISNQSYKKLSNMVKVKTHRSIDHIR